MSQVIVELTGETLMLLQDHHPPVYLGRRGEGPADDEAEATSTQRNESITKRWAPRWSKRAG
ncbi:MAG: hypothetical protein V3U14_09335 [candidate division NC10 bacterium]|jgi:hypothetical protein